MGRKYTASFDNIVVSAAQDVFEINAPADAIVDVLAAYLGQSSDYGDSEAEGLRVTIEKSTGLTGSGGAAVTPETHEGGDSAFGGTVERNNTTRATTRAIKHEDVFNIQVGWEYRPTFEERITISPGARLLISLPGAPNDPVNMSGSVVLEERGG